MHSTFRDEPVEHGATDHFGGLDELLNNMEFEFSKTAELQSKSAVDESDIEKMWNTAAQQGFKARSALGLKFNRAPDGGQNPQYAGAKLTNAERDEFRKKWALAQYQKVTLMKQKSTEWSRVDVKVGRYLPFVRILQEEGGDSRMQGALQQAVQAAKNYCQKCMAMQGKWYKFNQFTGRMEFLYVQSSEKEIFAEAWSSFERNHEEVSATDASHYADNAQPARVPSTPTIAEDTGCSQGARHEQVGKPAKKKKCEEVAKSPVDSATGAANKLKKDIRDVQAQYAGITASAQNDPEWKWAQKNLEELTVIKSDIDRSMTSFCRSLTTMDVRDVRRNMDDSEFVRQVATTEQAMGDKVAAAQREIRALLRMHKGRREA